MRLSAPTDAASSKGCVVVSPLRARGHSPSISRSRHCCLRRNQHQQHGGGGSLLRTDQSSTKGWRGLPKFRGVASCRTRSVWPSSPDKRHTSLPDTRSSATGVSRRGSSKQRRTSSGPLHKTDL